MNIRWANDAVAQLEAISDFIALDDEDAAPRALSNAFFGPLIGYRNSPGSDVWLPMRRAN